MSKGSVENYSFISIKQLNLKSLFSADDLKKYKKISITASNDYGSYNLSLTHSPCNYGGARFWFLCSCGKRCTKLYLKRGAYACRQCQQLNYMSQQWNKIYRYYASDGYGIACNGHKTLESGQYIKSLKTCTVEHLLHS